MEYFVHERSIVREIWGKSDTILLIFVGASAEFALNKAVDWLYFTGKLPADPIGRLFSTVAYAKRIVFSRTEEAAKAIDQINNAHGHVERARGAKIPEWAYRDVLFMLIDYSIRSFELLERKLTLAEKQEVISVFIKLGKMMDISGLPESFQDFVSAREAHLQTDLANSKFTKDLYLQYKKHLGPFRFRLYSLVQTAVVPPLVEELLSMRGNVPALYLIKMYQFSRILKLDKLMKKLILPSEYMGQIKALDINPG